MIKMSKTETSKPLLYEKKFSMKFRYAFFMILMGVVWACAGISPRGNLVVLDRISIICVFYIPGILITSGGLFFVLRLRKISRFLMFLVAVLFIIEALYCVRWSFYSFYPVVLFLLGIIFGYSSWYIGDQKDISTSQ